MRPEHLGEFHITKGQLLNLPYDKDDGLIRASNFNPYTTRAEISAADRLWYHLEQHRNFEEFPKDSTRFDIEPDWGQGRESDQQTVVLNMRQTGILTASINLGDVLSRLGRCMVNCSCRGEMNETALKEALASLIWHRLNIEDLKSSVQRRSVKPIIADRGSGVGGGFIIDASQCPEALVYVLGILKADAIVVTEGCLVCAIKQVPKSEPTVVVVVAGPKLDDGNALVSSTR